MTLLRLAYAVLATLLLAQAHAADQEAPPVPSRVGTEQSTARAPQMRPRVGIRTPEPSAAHPATGALKSFLKAHARPAAPATNQRTNARAAGSTRTNPTAAGNRAAMAGSAASSKAGTTASPTANAMGMATRAAALRASASPALMALNKNNHAIGGPHAPTSVLGGIPPTTTLSKAARIDGTAMRRRF